ncbi:MAG: metalloregulator ArsR/SmtB family transcription factor, partial [Selenomonadaceae bacterium]|nr:metalloregulator ArsR/SmtB family transcription factor [Selenomonadaceae bacterium]
MDYRNDAKLFKALSDENRLQILAQLNNEEKCACVLLEKLAISQPTLSHHMR